MEEVTEITDKPKTKPGPKAKPSVSVEEFNELKLAFNELKEQYIKTERAFIKVCHYSGNNRILIDEGFTPYEINKKDMGKYA